VLFWIVECSRSSFGDKSDVSDRGIRSIDSPKENRFSTSQRSNRASSRTIKSHPLNLADWSLSDSDMQVVKLLDSSLKASELERVIDSSHHYRARIIPKGARKSLGIPLDSPGEIELLIVQSIVQAPTSVESDKLRSEIFHSVDSLSSISATEKELAVNFFKHRYLSDTFKFKLLESKAYILVEGGTVRTDYSVSVGDYYDVMVTEDDEEREAFFLRGTPKYENTDFNPMGKEKERYGHIFESASEEESEEVSPESLK
jgi:hypothetical protein